MKIINQFLGYIPSIFRSQKILLIFFAFSLAFFLFSTSFYIYSNYTPWGKAAYYERLASKLPPSSLQANRYRAMAEAIRQGKDTYTFTASQIPPLGGK